MCAASYLPSGLRWAFNFREWKPSPQEWEFAVRCVQKEEKDRMYRFVFIEDIKASLVGHLLMRKAASDFIGIPYHEIHFTRSKSGKPFIGNFSDLIQKVNYTFNISHNGDLCVLAAEMGCCVGIDVMKIDYTRAQPVCQFFSLIRKQFSFEEMEFISAPGVEIEKLKRFYRIWCLKESYVKAKGTGITENLKNLSFHCPTPSVFQNMITCDTKLTVDGNLASNWRFEETIIDDHCVCVALQNDPGERPERERSGVQYSLLSYGHLMMNSIPFENVEEKDWKAFQSKKEKNF